MTSHEKVRRLFMHNSFQGHKVGVYVKEKIMLKNFGCKSADIMMRVSHDVTSAVDYGFPRDMNAMKSWVFSWVLCSIGSTRGHQEAVTPH